MLLGVERRDAAARSRSCWACRSILGAAAKEGLELRHMHVTGEMGTVLPGRRSPARRIVGYLTVRFLLRFLATHRLDLFAYYRLALAAVVW